MIRTKNIKYDSTEKRYDEIRTYVLSEKSNPKANLGVMIGRHIDTSGGGAYVSQ